MLGLIVAALALSAPSSTECREMTIANDGGGSRTVMMCKGKDGTWREASVAPLAAAAAAPLPARAKATYQGTYDVKVTVPMRIPNRLTIGSLVKAAGDASGKRLVGGITFRATFEGQMVTMEAETTGGDTGRFRLSGTYRNGDCLLQAPGGKITYQGRCGATGFSGKLTGYGNRGEKVSGQFDAPVSGPVIDVALAEQYAEQERLRIQAEQRRKAEAAKAALEALPRAGPAWTTKMEGFVSTDARGWAFNRYDIGSMRNVRIASGSARTGTMVLRGEYTYNGGAQGWVFANIVGGKFDCIQFWDAMIGCRALRTAAQGQAMRGAALSLLTDSGGSGGGGSGGCDSNCEFGRDMLSQQQRDYERSQSAPPPPPPPPMPSPLGW